MPSWGSLSKKSCVKNSPVTSSDCSSDKLCIKMSNVKKWNSLTWMRFTKSKLDKWGSNKLRSILMSHIKIIKIGKKTCLKKILRVFDKYRVTSLYLSLIISIYFLHTPYRLFHAKHIHGNRKIKYEDLSLLHWENFEFLKGFFGGKSTKMAKIGPRIGLQVSDVQIWQKDSKRKYPKLSMRKARFVLHYEVV